MREILFRGKRVGNGKWIEGDLLSSGVYPDRLWITESKTFFDKQLQNIGIIEVDPATVGQYTGLQDKNGKKIFEGDILRCCTWYIGGREGDYTNFLVSFLDDSYCAGMNPLGSWLFDSINGNTKLRYVEVISNVHENPELLEVK